MKLSTLISRMRPARPDVQPPAVQGLRQIAPLTLPGLARTVEAAQHPVLGFGVGDLPVLLTPEHGHVLLAGGAGHGCTVALRGLVAQYLRRGVEVDLLDLHFEHTWAHHLPGMTRVEHPDALARHLAALAEQVRSGPGGRQRVLMIESAATAEAVCTGAAAEALTTLLAHGRTAGVRVVMACHDVPRNLPGRARDRFTTRLLAHPSDTTWRWATGGEPPPTARSDGGPGRMHLVSRTGAAPAEVQVLYLTQAQARAFARGTDPAKEPGR
ncbi:hypothetical protein [Streptomyces luteireticuli]|uniref:hypothetical protein n=1 Tax=Streptomyces luteireticuli TaxID=173858 RepID=UPI0035563B77